MKYFIRRTSRYNDEKPCEEAYMDNYVSTDARSADDPAKIDYYGGETSWWYKEGRNHRVVDGYICRDYDAKGWFVDINTLDELMQFINKYGEVVVSPKGKYSQYDSIEIYDSYRE